jgi:hypothetical protein
MISGTDNDPGDNDPGIKTQCGDGTENSRILGWGPGGGVNE